MKAILLFTVMLGFTASSFADEYVNGYMRRDGTYIPGHMRSDSDSSYNNNWTVRGNSNPYTGEVGTRSPTYNDRTPQYNTNTYGTPGYSDYGSSLGRGYRGGYR